MPLHHCYARTYANARTPLLLVSVDNWTVASIEMKSATAIGVGIRGPDNCLDESCRFVSLIAAAAWAYPNEGRLTSSWSNRFRACRATAAGRSSARPRRATCKGKSATIIAQKPPPSAGRARRGARSAHAAKPPRRRCRKQAVVEQLQQEVHEAEAVGREHGSQQQATTNAACQAAQQATAQHKLMVQATQLAALLEKSAHCVPDKTKFGLQEKCHTLAEARSRLAHLQHKLQCAIAECAATKHAAHSACEAARAACGNARKRNKPNTLRPRKSWRYHQSRRAGNDNGT
ncbi:hypothetical protein EVAR_98525_1 [Eumeta japonica]|uniref:Uncharacterized protein n=1 Tax=Eumeta variegata TaxID=151549 RepID=A0A4C1ZZ70_EUMVA|nr:hypothetical protein EVAR_98525_1 [Eumeta japonica]